MKRKARWGFFPFDAMDYKAAQAYLDKKAAAGWVLDRISFKWFARFVPAEGRYHGVDLNLHSPADGDEDYIQLCRDAGWELVCDVRKMLLFRSMPERRPAPLQTDEGMEADRFWKKYVRKQVWILLAVLLVFVPLIYLSSRQSYIAVISTMLCRNYTLFQLPGLAGLMVYLLWSFGSTVICYLRFHRLGRLPERGRTGAWQMGVMLFTAFLLIVAGWCLNMAEGFGLGKTVDVSWSRYSEEYTATPELCQSYPVLTAADLGLEPSQEGRYLDGRAALPASWLEYTEMAPEATGERYILHTERYQCASTPLARLMLSARREETARGEFVFGFKGNLEWEEAPDLGFDECWVHPDGRYILFRQGRTVALVGATGFDLTQPDYLDSVRQRLLPGD